MRRLAALSRRWADLPPAAVSLSRIAQWLGAVPKEVATGSPLQQAIAAGVPVSDTLPDDPDLIALELDLAPGQPLIRRS